MEQTTRIMKDCEVEVTSEEKGFKNSCFRAILEEDPTNSPCQKLRVRYLTLLDVDGLSPLVEHVEQNFIRPVPPEDNQYRGSALEEGLVVDADHNHGWWTGVVVKKTWGENYLVYFDFPDILQFERKQLRIHLNWTGSNWIRPDIKELNTSMFSPGTMVEVCYSKGSGWFPSMIIKEIGVDDNKKFIVKSWNEYLSYKRNESTKIKYLSCKDNVKPKIKYISIIEWSCVRPTPPPSSDHNYALSESIEVWSSFFGWSKGMVREIICDKFYTVVLAATRGKSIVGHSNLRPFMVWEDGVWHKYPKLNFLKRKPRTPKIATTHMRGSLNPGKTLIKAENVAATVESGKKGADAVMMDDKTPPVITQQVTSIAEESVSPVTPSLVVAATALKQTEAETEGIHSPKKPHELTKNQNGSENSSTRPEMFEEENGSNNSRKRKREQKHNLELNATDETCNGLKAEINDTSNNTCVKDIDDQPLSAYINISTEPSIDEVPNVVDNSHAEGEETQANTLVTLPFAKNMPFWKTCETEEVYKTIPQNPHFRPLVEVKEDIREWLAVGMTVSFYGLLQEVKDLKLDVSLSKLNSVSSSFAELEKQGFDVSIPQSHINKVFSLKDGRAKKVEERKCLEKKIDDEETKRHKFEDEMVELEHKILELKRQEAVAKENKEAADRVIVETKARAETIDQEIADEELEFLTSVLVQW